MISGIARLLPSRRGYHEETPRILAILAPGADRSLLQATSQDFGWNLTLSEAPPHNLPKRRAALAPIVLYDRELPPYNWRDVFCVLTKESPRPYAILLSPNVDQNLWDELQRVGGSDILRAPVTREDLLWAVTRAWLLWRGQQKVRSRPVTR
jgi:FixJ family two-component response regulator